MSRPQDRAGMDEPTRIRLLETDADAVERLIEQVRRDTRAEFEETRKDMKEGFADCKKDSAGVKRTLITVLLSVVGSSIVIVATVLIAAGGAPS